MTNQEVVDRAHQAARLLEDPTLQKAFLGVREALVQRIEASPIGDSESHHSFAQQLQALREVNRQLQKWISEKELLEARAKIR
jgi:hypothetical protein